MLVIGVKDKPMKIAKKVDGLLAALWSVSGGWNGAQALTTHAIWGFSPLRVNGVLIDYKPNPITHNILITYYTN